ncbi:acyltransferase family protein [Subtercola boreus]|uniref:Acyltransferase n=1 Tax=Subtercola boreus TaxID=120213 RepID=A0A3E0W7U5_9MICO|nr:acyltransferase [Subtercola boreus]RFA18753.1 acyltransferase [Subtercola boreus]RFA18870.1 acyltransferase [Subtercola boreus]RFA25405.1 acyltransferase [Subtercola boreus]
MASTTATAGTLQSSRPKIAFLEAVRGVAALVVVLQHIFAAQIPLFAEWSRDYVDFGRVGVVAFFVVSGYVIPLSLEHQSAKVFVVRRLFRLFPLYWLTLVLYIVFALATGTFSTQNAMPVVLITNVLMLQGLTPVLTIIPTAWTLGIELLFYVQELFASLVKRLAAAVYAGYAWLAIFALAELACRMLRVDLPTTLPLLLYTAAIGQALYLRDHHGSTVWRGLVISGLVIVPVFTYVGGMHDPAWPEFTYAVSYLIGLALFAGFYLFAKRQAHPFLVWLGAVSYAVYLVHPLVYRAVALTGLNPVLCIAGSVVLSLVVAWVLHRTVELPFIAIGRRISGRTPTPSS